MRNLLTHPGSKTTNNGFQSLDPLPKLIRSRALVGDKVDVIGHDHEAAWKPMVPFWTIQQERREPLKDLFVIEHTDTPVDAQCYKISNRSLTVRPDRA